MKVTIRGEKTKITQAMSDYANNKLAKLDKYVDNSDNVNANVLVKIRNHQDKVEVTIPLKTFILRAEESQDDFYAAIDVVVEKLERQIRKNKTRLQTQQLRDKKEFAFENFEVDDNEEEKEVIVKRKKVEVKPMSEEEAILQMELLGHQFYLFKEADTNAPTVVYKRKDGNYGVIESE